MCVRMQFGMMRTVCSPLCPHVRFWSSRDPLDSKQGDSDSICCPGCVHIARCYNMTLHIAPCKGQKRCFGGRYWCGERRCPSNGCGKTVWKHAVSMADTWRRRSQSWLSLVISKSFAVCGTEVCKLTWDGCQDDQQDPWRPLKRSSVLGDSALQPEKRVLQGGDWTYLPPVLSAVDPRSGQESPISSGKNNWRCVCGITQTCFHQGKKRWIHQNLEEFINLQKGFRMEMWYINRFNKLSQSASPLLAVLMTSSVFIHNYFIYFSVKF